MRNVTTWPNRRDLLRLGACAGALGLGLLMPGRRLLAAAQSAGVRWRTLVMIKFDGGNDALNTVVPYADPLYGRYRPTVALSPDAMIPLGASYAFNAALAPLASGTGTAWADGDMAVLLGVGFPDLLGEGSHFTASDIWGTAVPSIDTPPDGWVTRLLNHLAAGDRPAGPIADAALIGTFPLEAVSGDGIRAVVTQPGGSSGQGRTVSPAVQARAAANPVYAWMVQEQGFVDAAAKPLQQAAALTLTTTFPATAIGQQLAHAARLILGGTAIPIISLNHGGYDTHMDQKRRQNILLGDFATAVAAFRAELQLHGAWNNVLVMTHSEFGRCVVENSLHGTDHGHAGTHFLLGGQVNGGLVGTQAPLSSIVPDAPGLRGLASQTDFRQIYASVMQDWWNVPRSISDAVVSDDGAYPVSFASLGLTR